MPLFNFETFDPAAQREELARSLSMFREWDDRRVTGYALSRALGTFGDTVMHCSAERITLTVMGSQDFNQSDLARIVSGCLRYEGRDYHFARMGLRGDLEYDYGCPEGSPTVETEFVFEVRR